MLLVSQVKINGRITSNNTGLKFANITLLDSTEKTFINGTVSDSIGRFEIETKLGSYKLIISHISYENWSQNIQLTQNINLGEIVLTEKEYELNEVVVEGKKLIFEREMNKLIFHVQNSPLKDGYNALELLQRSPKVFVNGNGGISLKNGSPTISINGRKLNLRAGELDIYLSGLNSENIEKIEIQDIRSAELEASSTGGGINIILKKAPKGFSSIINSTFINRENDYDKYAGGISLNFGSNKWSSYAKINYDDNSDLGGPLPLRRPFSILV
ncbi:carboxypeptidase-like regulatory domain-containing protein [Algibacter lectus]|nr:carboxypeptidase-like regulatory domain-containing protein [Algibacter lectus]